MNKMEFRFLLLACCLVAVFNFAESADFKFVKCDEGDSIAEITRFTVSPDPVSLSNNLTTTVSIQVFKDLPPNTFVRLKVYKITQFFGLQIPVPCIGGSGSCTTEICKYFSEIQKQACPFFPKEAKCGCPIKAGLYGGENIVIPFPEMGPVIKWIASGYFKSIWQLITIEENQENILMCYEFTGETVS